MSTKLKLKPRRPTSAQGRRQAHELAGGAAIAKDAGGDLLPAELLKDSLGYAIKRTQVRCTDALFKVLPADLSPTRMSALSTIGANPGISQSALGEVLHVAPPSVVKVVDILERIGLVERRTAKSDRRVYALFLTSAGETEVERCRTLVAAYEREISSQLSKTERSLLLDLLARVAV